MMLNKTRLVLTLAFATAATLPVAGQMWVTKTEQQGQGASGSPKVRTEWYIDTGTVSLAYSRPSLKGRALDAVLAKSEPWKASDDEPATLTSNKPLVFANINVPAGAYSLWVIPEGDVWTLAINKATGGAASKYAQAQDVGRIAMKTDKLAKPVDQALVTIEPSSDRVTGGVQLAVEFGNLRAVAPFLVRR
jgi:hypothetical protein